MKRAHTILLASALAIAHGSASQAQSTVAPDLQAEGDRLRAAVIQLNQQWQQQTGQPLFPSGAPPMAGVPAMAGGPAAQVDPATLAAYQAALAQLQAGVSPGAAFPNRTAMGNGIAPLASTGFALPGGVPASNSASVLNRETAGTADFSPANVDGRDKIPVGYEADGTLIMTINSDNPGPWKGQLSRPILSIDKTRVLFPEGSIVTGRAVRVTGTNEVINPRLGLVPTYITRPNGESMKIRQQSVLDQFGINGVEDVVNYHVWAQLGAVAALTFVQSAPQVLSNQTTKQGTTTTLYGTFLNQGNYATSRTIDRYLELVPTITIRAGAPFRIFFSEEQFAPPLRQRDNFQLTNVGLPPPSNPTRPGNRR